MTSDFEALLRAIRSCSAEQKQEIFSEIRDSITIHPLEQAFNVKGEVILEAISRASDLTQRGILGVIAEAIFSVDVVPTVQEWIPESLVGNHSYDCHLSREACHARIQVKRQRRKDGQPMVRDGLFVVEVQRTRGGERDGVNTRPYRFGEFDLIAVCMEPSTGNWKDFMYAPASQLEADASDPSIIRTLQSVPPFSEVDQGMWTSSLAKALEKLRGTP